MIAMEAPLYQSYHVYIINKVRAKTEIHLGKVIYVYCRGMVGLHRQLCLEALHFRGVWKECGQKNEVLSTNY
jgi:hypothetical protein